MDLMGQFEEIDGDAQSAADAVDPRDSRHQTLSKIFESHCLLDLRFEHGTGAYQTAILELVPGAGYFVIDALTPADGNAQAASKPSVRLRTRLLGMEVKFSSRIIQRGSHNDLPYYKMLYPQSIEVPQRRREYRVTVPLDKGVAVRFYTREGACVRGEIRDLSPGGFSARLLSGDTGRIERDVGHQVVCEIDLPRHATVRASIEICHVFPSRGRSAPRVGARFIDIDARSERQLEHCVAELDRERARLR